MKAFINTIFILTFAVACYDSNKNGDNTDSDSTHGNESESGEQSVDSSDDSFITVEACIASCEFEVECGLMTSVAAMTDTCEEMCPLSVDLMSCLYTAYSPACQVAYKAYFDCYNNIDNCNDLNSLINGSASDADTDLAPTSYVCQSEIEAYLMCTEQMEDQLTEEICADEINALAEFWQNELFPDDTEMTDADIKTQKSTLYGLLNHL